MTCSGGKTGLGIYADGMVEHGLLGELVVGAAKGGKVAGEGGLDGGVVFPRGFLGHWAFEFVQRESQLERHGVFRPEGAVIVEDRDALGRRHKVRRCFVAQAGEESDDRFFRCGVLLRSEGRRDLADRVSRGGETGRNGG